MFKTMDFPYLSPRPTSSFSRNCGAAPVGVRPTAMPRIYSIV